MVQNCVKEVVGAVMSEQNVAEITDELSHMGFEPLEISYQDDIDQMRMELGKNITNVEEFQDEEIVSRKSPPHIDDMAWMYSFIVAIPVFIAMIIGIFVVGIEQDTSQVYLGAFLGGLVGFPVGLFIESIVLSHHRARLAKIIESGGIVVWVRAESDEKERKARFVFKKYGAHGIHTHERVLG